MKYLTVFCLAFPLFVAAPNCSDKNAQHKNTPQPVENQAKTLALPAGFNEYWFGGQAELSTYDVTQERYGELRRAEQLDVFVTEDFSRSRQVKLDDATGAGADREPVLKLNTVRRFHTGIYDYSVEQSVFTPLNGTPTLKSTTTIQDWCGHVFLQYNLKADAYRLRSFSYFDKEGDQDQDLPLALLEDELWTRIRLMDLPLGEVMVIPSSVYTRFRHQDNQPKKAVLSLEKGEKENSLKLIYSTIPRTLNIRFEAAFPYRILGWEEMVDGKLMSKGTRKALRKSAYWTEHNIVHEPLRDSLQVHF